MIEIEVNEKNLKDFIENVRPEDKEELEYSFKTDYKRIFIEACLKEKNIWFLADKYKKPCAIGGIQYEKDDKTGLVRGRVWLLCANNLKENCFYLIKYIKNKIRLIKNNADILYNHIYKSNFYFLKWLKKYGFKTIDINNEVKFFYYIKENNIDT